MEKIRVILADDHTAFRAGLRVLLETQPDIQVVEEASDGFTAVRKARELHPDVLVLDIKMAGLDGLEAIRRLVHKAPYVKSLVLTMYEGQEFVFRALAAGASGYLLKRTAHTDIAKAIRTIHQGDVFLYPSDVKALLDDYLQRAMRNSERESYSLGDAPMGWDTVLRRPGSNKSGDPGRPYVDFRNGEETTA